MKSFLITKCKSGTNITLFTIIIFLIILGSSCVSHKNLLYLQKQAEDPDTLLFEKQDYKIATDDILHVRVHTFDEETDRIFNKEAGNQQMRSGGDNMTTLFYLQGYSVTREGDINLPVLGRVNVAGKTIEQATRKIEELLEEYITGATVVLKLVNFSITILGDVNVPGQYYIYDNRISIMDALGMTGDMSDFGNREVKIVRQTSDGAIFKTLDLKDYNVHKSEFFYLRPNDLVYVEPYKVKRLGFDTFPFALVFSTISTTLLLINFFSN
ncbi:MAG: polysaccharide biosynthesis/export family protein [Bacteroidota bacterium]